MNKLKKLLKLDNIIYFLLIVIFGLIFSVKYIDNDLFFDLKTGETILKYGIDFKDHFSFIPNLTYLYHHWFYDLFVYFINTNFGLLGIKVFFAGIFILFSLIYFISCNKVANNKIVSLLVTGITMYFASYAFTLRVQSITYLLFFLEILFLNKIYETGNKKYLIILGLISILLVNIHMPLWIFSIVLFLPYLVSAFISYLSTKKRFKLLKKYLSIDKPFNYKIIWITLLVLTLAGVISPYGYRPYTFFIEVLMTDSYNLLEIVELAKTSLILFKYPLFIMVVLVTGSYFKLLKINMRDFFLVVGLFIFSLLAVRNVIFFHLVGPYIVLKSLVINLDFHIKFKKIRINKTVVESTIIICLIFITGYVIKLIDYPNNTYNIEDDYPVKMTKYIKDNLDYKNIRIYNHFNFGSYLEYNDIPVFIDSRAEVYIKEFNGGYDIASDYVDTFEIEKYEKIFKKYKFDYALVYKESQTDYKFKLNDNFEKVKTLDDFVLYKIKDDFYK